MNSAPNILSFLEAEGEMADLVRSYDWSQTGLGEPASWPNSLKTKLNTIMHSAFPMFLFWGEDLICFYNDAFRPSLGDNGKHPALGKKGKEVWSDIWDFIGPLINQVLTTGKAVWFEDQLVPFYRNGRTEDVYWTFSYSGVTDDHNKIAGVVVVCTETTEKVNLFKQLQEFNDLYSFAIDASELGTWDLNPITNKFTSNNRLKEWFGFESNEEIDLSLALDIVAEEDRERVAAAILKSLEYASGGFLDVEYTIVHAKTGQRRIVKAKGKAAFDEHGQVTRLNGTLQDITVEVIAREQNRKLSILVENSVDLMAILKMDGKNSYINKAGRELLGIDEDADITQIPISDFHTPEQLAFVTSEIIPAVMSKGIWAGEFAVKNGKTGEIIPLYNNCHRIDDERTGKPIGIGTVMRDIRSELNARQKLEDEVAKRTQELVKLNEELERKNRDLASFAFVSSHDLQEPLRKINTFISMVERDKIGEKNMMYLNKIRNSASRMQTLIRDLLSFSRTDANEGTLESCDLNEVIREVETEFQDELEKVSGKISFDALPVVRAVPFQLNQLFSNLVSNSIKFSKKEQPLFIKITSEIVTEKYGSFERFYKVSFADNGIGFDPRYNEKIFKVFQRLNDRNSYEGTGIGLSICEKIMENHQGFIKAEGVSEVGATFYLYFPVN